MKKLILLSAWVACYPVANAAMGKLTVADVMNKKKQLSALIEANVRPEAKPYLRFLLEKSALIDAKIQKSGQPLLKSMGVLGASVLFAAKGADLNDPFTVAKIRYLDKVFNTGESVSGFLAKNAEMFRIRTEAGQDDRVVFDQEVGVPYWSDRMSNAGERLRTGEVEPSKEMLLASDMRSLRQGVASLYAVRSLVVPTRFQKRKILPFARTGDAVALGRKDISAITDFVSGLDFTKAPSLEARLAQLLNVAASIFGDAEVPAGKRVDGDRAVFEVPGQKHDLVWRRDLVKGWGFRLSTHGKPTIWDVTLNRVDKQLKLGRFDGKGATIDSAADLPHEEAVERYIISDMKRSTIRLWGRFNFAPSSTVPGFFIDG